MGNPAGVRRDFEKLEQRRLEAAELLRQGLHQGRWLAEWECIGNRSAVGPRNWSAVVSVPCARRDVPAAGRICTPRTCGASRRDSSGDRKRWATRPACGLRGGWLI